MTTSEQIKQWRGERTLEQAARDVGVTVSTLHRWEKGAEPGGLGRKALERAGLALVRDECADTAGSVAMTKDEQ